MPPDQVRDESGRAAPARVHRRQFITLAATGGIVAAGGVALAFSEDNKGPGHPATARTTTPATATKPATGTAQVTNTKLADGVTIPVNPAIVAENAKIGHAWWVTTPQQVGDIQGYANQCSAAVGDTITLFVSTKAPHFHVEAYRMGYYHGIGARLVWQSDEVAGVRQTQPTVVAPTNTIACNWNPSLTVPVTATWPPGAYLLKLVGPANEQ